jgi:hypothetical protein
VAATAAEIEVPDVLNANAIWVLGHNFIIRWSLTAVLGPTDSSYEWVADEWSVLINFMVTKLTKLGDQTISIQAGLKYWAARRAR